MTENKCNFCGNVEHETRTTEYLYSYKGNYLLVPDTPVEICCSCGMIYFDALVLKNIEKRFFAIQSNKEKPDCYLEMPRVAYDSIPESDFA
ncbi:type II toxin-antitoxin system MqsA family antitoxin [Desulfonatronum parangueonense]